MDITNPPTALVVSSYHPMITRSCIRSLKLKQFPAIIDPNFVPTTTAQVMKYPHWHQEIVEKYTAILKDDIWQLISPNPTTNLVGCKWVFIIR